MTHHSQRIVEILMDRREMLSEYFATHITEDGLLESIPLLLRDYTPNLDKLPLFLMRLGPQVDEFLVQPLFDWHLIILSR